MIHFLSRWGGSIMSWSHGQNRLLKAPNTKGQKSCFWNTQNKKSSASGSKKCTIVPPSLTQQQADSAFSPACNYQRWQLPQVFPAAPMHLSEGSSGSDFYKGKHVQMKGGSARVHWFSHIISKLVKPIISRQHCSWSISGPRVRWRSPVVPRVGQQCPSTNALHCL